MNSVDSGVRDPKKSLFYFLALVSRPVPENKNAPLPLRRCLWRGYGFSRSRLWRAPRAARGTHRRAKRNGATATARQRRNGNCDGATAPLRCARTCPKRFLALELSKIAGACALEIGKSIGSELAR